VGNASDVVLQVTGLHKRYGPTVALQGLSFTVPRGSFMGLFGRNGSGKTTTFDIITGLISRDQGQVVLLDELVQFEPSPATKRRLAYVGGHLSLYHWLSVQKHLDLVSGFYPTWDWDHCREVLALFRLPLDQQVFGLSPGQHLQLQLVMALAHHPELLIIDEPGNLDPVVRLRLIESITEILRQQQATVVMASHLLDELQGVCDQMCIIDRGQTLVAGPVAELTAQAREVHFRGVKAAAQPPPVPGVWFRDFGGGECRAVFAAFDEKLAAAVAAQLDAEGYDAAPTGLQEFFIALTAERE
jgi:ABC-2 type transport system ATP-binding protein